MASTPTPTTKHDHALNALNTQKELEKALGISRWMVADRISRYPKGRPNAFPIEYVGRWRRFHIPAVRAWFAWEAAGFPGGAVPAVLSAWYAAHSPATPAA